VLPETEFAIGANRLRPDIAVLAREEFERIGEGRSPVRELPEIAIEIASPSESASEMERKVAAYLEAGVGEVWVVYPRTQHVYVYTGFCAQLVDRESLLTTAFLPGWSLPVGDIFAV
jgi:Uma2 family endonuclease